MPVELRSSRQRWECLLQSLEDAINGHLSRSGEANDDTVTDESNWIASHVLQPIRYPLNSPQVCLSEEHLQISDQEVQRVPQIFGFGRNEIRIPVFLTVAEDG